jgi:hypothetical protein
MLSNLTLWSVSHIDNYPLTELKHSQSDYPNAILLSDYIALSPNIISYMFKICEHKH